MQSSSLHKSAHEITSSEAFQRLYLNFNINSLPLILIRKILGHYQSHFNTICKLSSPGSTCRRLGDSARNLRDAGATQHRVASPPLVLHQAIEPRRSLSRALGDLSQQNTYIAQTLPNDLSDALAQNKSLISLDLSKTPLDQIGLEGILYSLCEHPTISVVNMKGISQQSQNMLDSLIQTLGLRALVMFSNKY
ncbi:hypothetical protein PPL_04055 [Heterostelium album PN500]|uniref:Uncharacterized protein n=1 Tax=Heterostelium pallidum (strain ATCC 26659 / Pp 5 / PN500) TaxID=670386 RepID=D3B5W7_HETP5|nr:hypothetical protein PPL_04055 [Heterostelium album PN500]EFA83265.1 hypothetical protein PPL_04055 [Heterostelium album PN500]|eukprot:XP_020435382.1 hypothetical protein PPL_04055 [Heterostelium album PN500]